MCINSVCATLQCPAVNSVAKITTFVFSPNDCTPAPEFSGSIHPSPKKENNVTQDCQFVYQLPWSMCTSNIKCGIGVMLLQNSIVKQSINGGKKCEELFQLKTCILSPCGRKKPFPLMLFIYLHCIIAEHFQTKLKNFEIKL